MSDPSDECDRARYLKMREISKTAKLIKHSIEKSTLRNGDINGVITYEHWKYQGLSSSPIYTYSDSKNVMWVITQRRGTGDSVIAIDSTKVGWKFVSKSYEFNIPIKFQQKENNIQRKFSWKHINPLWGTTCDLMLDIEATTFELTKAPLQQKPNDSTELIQISSNNNPRYSNKKRLMFSGCIGLRNRKSILGNLTYKNERIELGSIIDSERCAFVSGHDTICVTPIASKAKILNSIKNITLF
jgi:hypothetical protein